MTAMVGFHLTLISLWWHSLGSCLSLIMLKYIFIMLWWFHFMCLTGLFLCRGNEPGLCRTVLAPLSECSTSWLLLPLRMESLRDMTSPCRLTSAHTSLSDGAADFHRRSRVDVCAGRIRCRRVRVGLTFTTLPGLFETLVSVRFSPGTAANFGLRAPHSEHTNRGSNRDTDAFSLPAVEDTGPGCWYEHSASISITDRSELPWLTPR